jgi:hypothetical protein
MSVGQMFFDQKWRNHETGLNQVLSKFCNQIRTQSYKTFKSKFAQPISKLDRFSVLGEIVHNYETI